MIRFTQKVTKTTSNGIVYPRISITQYLNELDLEPGDQLTVEIDKNKKTITIKVKE